MLLDLRNYILNFLIFIIAATLRLLFIFLAPRAYPGRCRQGLCFQQPNSSFIYFFFILKKRAAPYIIYIYGAGAQAQQKDHNLCEGLEHFPSSRELQGSSPIAQENYANAVKELRNVAGV